MLCSVSVCIIDLIMLTVLQFLVGFNRIFASFVSLSAIRNSFMGGAWICQLLFRLRSRPAVAVTVVVVIVVA